MIPPPEQLGVIFDWDGVLIDSHDLHERSWLQLAGELGQTLPDGFFKSTFGMRNAQIIPAFTTWAEPDEPERIADLALRKETIYREMLQREGIALLPGARALLDSLGRAGVPCAIGSSAPRKNLSVVLDLLDLGSRFAAITASEDVSRGKPDPEVFLRCARALQRHPERCVVLEDAPAGVRAGLAAGMTVIGVSSTHPPETLREASLVVPDLTQVPSLLRIV